MGLRIAKARKDRGLTQSDLGRLLDVSHSTVNRWEAGHREPPRDTVARIARITGVPVEWLERGGSPVFSGGGQGAIRGQDFRGRQEPPRYEAGTPPRTDSGAGSMFKNPVADNPVIAFQGIPGAYSHLACREAFPDMEPLACPTFEDAFAAVEEGRAGLGMIPIENSLGGRVADIHHLLPDSNLYIVGEHFQPVHHHLLAPKGAKLEQIREARSHTQALAQTRTTLRELGIKAVQRADTAGAAKEVADLGDPTVAAVASSLAAETYGLDIVRSRIEDKIGNVTRFIVMSRVRIEPDPNDGPCMTSFVFQVRSVPAALYKSLGGFATNGINMIKLESYISVSDESRARFYAEIEGHPAEKHVDRALEELQFYTSHLKILGTYKQSAFRHRPKD